CTVAPTIADPSLVRVTVPAIDPGPLTVKTLPLLATPFTVTTTEPVVAPAGTGTPMLVALQLVGVAGVPLKVTVLDPWFVPKLVPAMVTVCPTAPLVGLRFAIDGGGTGSGTVITES